MVYDGRTRETSADSLEQLPPRTLKELGFEEEKGQLREWMTARDRSIGTES
jgi:hypothetical protein